jgi:hypothetical protein
MRALRLRFRLRTLLILVALAVLALTAGTRPAPVSAIYDATSMPGIPATKVVIYQQGWLVRLAGSLCAAVR